MPKRGPQAGHPHEETLERLGDVGSRIMSTTDSGAISINIHENKLKVRKYIGE